MKRTILSLTTAIALAMSAYAQTDVEMSVMQTLAENGYEENSIDMLSQGQIAEIYIASTSGDNNAIQNVLDGIDFEAGEMAAMSAPMSNIETSVRTILDERGYQPSLVNALSNGDIVNIYNASTSGNDSDVDSAIDSAIDANMTMAESDPNGAGERAREYLMRQGYTAAEIEMVDQAELVEIYIALTSGDENEVMQVVEGAMES
jgi:hypothetical protein